jgi:succinate dehydrogenase / fumarate reductase, cytochrome b subunit
MADVNRGNRPLSPFLTSYQQPFSAVLSILHRITGAGMLLAAILIVWWFLALADGPDSFQTADGIISSWVVGLIMLVSLGMLYFHLCNGVRHLFWDVGYGYEKPMVRKSGMAVIAVAAVLTLITWIVGYL